METQNKETKPVGAMIRRLRIEKNMTIRQLAQAVGVSASFLSRVERDQAVSSPYVLRKIALELQTRAILLMTAESSSGAIYFTRERERPKESHGETVYEHLTPGGLDDAGGRNLSVLRLTLKDKEKKAGQMTYGSPALYVVLCGRVECETGGQSYRLGEGDSLAIDKHASHRIGAAGEEEAKVLLILAHATT